MREKLIFASWVMVLGMAFGAGSALAEPARQAKITIMSGQVEWLKAGSDTWQGAKLNQQLSGGDKIRTGAEGQATLTLDEGSNIQIYPGSEFAIQTLNKDSKTQQLQSVLAILKGKLRAQVTPLKPGSTFEIETPIMTAAVKGTTFTLNINPDGTVSATSEDGAVDLTREGENNFVLHMDTGDEVLVEYNPETGDIKITSKKGSFEVIGPDHISRILKEGDSITFHGGAATFIPLTAPVNDPPTGNAFTEPAGGTTGAAASALSTSVSG